MESAAEESSSGEKRDIERERNLIFAGIPTMVVTPERKCDIWGTADLVVLLQHPRRKLFCGHDPEVFECITELIHRQPSRLVDIEALEGF